MSVDAEATDGESSDTLSDDAGSMDALPADVHTIDFSRLTWRVLSNIFLSIMCYAVTTWMPTFS